MAKYFNVRGFLDCDYSDLDQIKSVVAQYANTGDRFQLSNEVVALYLGGWLYQEKEINWIAHAFFGASMRNGGVDLILAQLEQIAQLIPESEGVFFVDDDEGAPSQRWDVANGRVYIQ
ncbi:hypothetical protein ACIPWB_31005 [[Kitasatospora] papulosa]|uniref:hypothetical protein n=1 Tax=[Kitasatospora] papulosa TaxID=1464011 RepID=UPI00381F93D6